MTAVAVLFAALTIAVSMTAVVDHRRLHTELAVARSASTADPLTGLPNRAGLARAWHTKTPAVTAVAVLDLDGFKPVNDAHGHAAGDRVLRVVAARLASCTPGVAARLGGDEFALLLTAARPEVVAVTLAARVAEPVEVGDGVTVSVTASIGVAPRGGDDLPVLLAAADAAMYRAKRTGCGVAVHEPHRDDHAQPCGRPAVRTRDLRREKSRSFGGLATYREVRP